MSPQLLLNCMLLCAVAMIFIVAVTNRDDDDNFDGMA